MKRYSKKFPPEVSKKLDFGHYDIALALMATQTQTTEVLDTFPTILAVQEAEQILAEAENPEVTIPQEA